MVLLLVPPFESLGLVTVMLAEPTLSPLMVMVEFDAPLLTETVATVGSEETALAVATAPPGATAVTVTLADWPRTTVAVGEESVSEAGMKGCTLPVAESNRVFPAPSLMTKLVML